MLNRFSNLFSLKLTNILLLRRPSINYAINLEPRSTTPRLYVYSLTCIKSKAVKVYIDNILYKGFIRLSTSLYAAPVLVVKKLGKEL